MPSIDEIRTAIKSIAETVPNIGEVYDQMPHVKMWDEVFQNLVTDNVLKVFFFTKLTRTPKAITESYQSWDKEHKWICKYIYSSNAENESDKTFDNLCESICAAFDKSGKLNGKAKKLFPMAQINKGYVMTCKVLCHYAEFELITTINI
ncbi:MAG: hypothetical protein HOP31_08860 [Ignavibacteria bacterium]|nr:hypothetical protein [Ignavibacteria bacterium]